MLYLFLFAHLVADFVLQPYWLVLRKRRLDGLLIHCGIVLGCMLLLTLADQAIVRLIPAMLVITMVHFAADWGKVHYGDRIPGPPIGPFLLDQLIHVTTLIAVLSVVRAPALVWGFEATPLAHLALYGSAYITAAFAAPIGVMIWLDPGFVNASLSSGARLRGLLAGVSVVSLTIFGGLLALPATLAGLVLLARHPRSSHPLDLPAGMLATLCVGATVGALTALIVYSPA